MTREALLDLRRLERVRDKARRALSILKAFTITTGVGVDIRLELDVEEGTADSGTMDAISAICWWRSEPSRKTRRAFPS